MAKSNQIKYATDFVAQSMKCIYMQSKANLQRNVFAVWLIIRPVLPTMFILDGFITHYLQLTHTQT